MNIATVIALFGAAFALAVLLEGAVEYLLGTPMDHSEKAKKWKWLLIYPSMIFGVLICLYYGLDLIVLIVFVLSKMAGGEVIWQTTTLGMVLSGIAIGRGSNYLHDFLVKVLVLPPVPKYEPPLSRLGNAYIMPVGTGTPPPIPRYTSE